jgi:hypothetical protein
VDIILNEQRGALCVAIQGSMAIYARILGGSLGE